MSNTYTSKVFSRILLDRFSATVEDISRPEQAGFRKGRSCIGHIFVLKQILEQTTEWNNTLYQSQHVLFIDFEKKGIRQPPSRNPLEDGFPVKIVNIIISVQGLSLQGNLWESTDRQLQSTNRSQAGMYPLTISLRFCSGDRG